MKPSFTDVIKRFRSGAKIEEKEFDLQLFRETERIKKKYDVHFDSTEFVCRDEAMADRCFTAGRELYASVGSYCLDTGSVARFTPKELDSAIDETPESVVWGAGDDAFVFRHRPVEGDVPAFVWGGIQTLLYSDEETALEICRICCKCTAVHGVWGGIVPHIEGLSEIRGGSPEEILPYRRCASILRQAAAQAGRPGMPVMNAAPLSMTHFAMFAGSDGLRPTDGIETGGMPELKISFDLMQRIAFALSMGTVHSGGLGVVIGGFSGSVEGAAIVAVASAYASRLIAQGKVVVLTATPIQTFSRARQAGVWVGTLALQALNRNAKMVTAGFMCDHPTAGPGTAQYFYETAAGTIPAIVCGSNSWGGIRKFNIGRTLDFGSPVESEFLGRITAAAVGMNRQHADKVASTLFQKYKDSLKAAPARQTLHELYDLKNEEPTPDYCKVYNRVAKELRDLGVAFEDYGA